MDQELKTMLELLTRNQQLFQEDVGSRFDKLDSRLDKVEVRLDSVDARLDKMDERLDKMDARFDKMDERLDKMDARFGSVDARFDQMDGRFNAVDEKLQVISDQLIRIETEGTDDIIGILEVMNTKLSFTATKEDINFLAGKLGQHDLEIDRLKRIK